VLLEFLYVFSDQLRRHLHRLARGGEGTAFDGPHEDFHAGQSIHLK
jgi:hypothetical protein